MRKPWRRFAAPSRWTANFRLPPPFVPMTSLGRPSNSLVAANLGSRPRMANRWWTYQRERFPIFAHTPIIAAFSLSAVSYSALIRGAHHLPPWQPCVVAIASSFLFFLQLRIADEFKDF